MSGSAANASRRVQWSSIPESNKFLVSGTNELRLCEYVHAAGGSNKSVVATHSSSAAKKRAASKTVGVCSDLPAFKVGSDILFVCVRYGNRLMWMISIFAELRLVS